MSVERPTCRRLVWTTFAQCLTFFIPNVVLTHIFRMKTSSSRTAWREKVALLALYLFSAGFFCVWLEFISCFFCEPETTYPYMQVFSNSSKMTAINGKAYKWKSEKHSDMVDFVNNYTHHDLSPNFPRFMVLNRISTGHPYPDTVLNDCIFNQNKSLQADAWLNYLLRTDPGYTIDPTTNTLTACPQPDQRNMSGAPCFYGDQYNAEFDSLPLKGDIENEPYYVSKYHNDLPTSENYTKQAYVMLDGYVLDVTNYLKAATKMIYITPTISSRAIVPDRMFLPLDLTLFLYLNLGKDITPYFKGNITEDPILYRTCLIRLFQKGVVPTHVASGCRRVNPALWATMGIGLVYFLIKMNLVYLSFLAHSPSKHTITKWPYTILMIPCFAECSDILKQTLDALSRTTYDDSKKLLVFVCDGIITNAKETKPTHTLLLECLGYSGTEEPIAQPYQSLGQRSKKINYARVYSGYYESGRNRVPYLVIVKVGTEEIPGNRGKRDSLLLVFSFLERCMDAARHRTTPLHYELFNQCTNVLGIDPRSFKYLMVTDADIQVQTNVVLKLVTRLEHEPTMVAVSGHIRPANPEENLITMLQIFPAYMAYFSSLAYEACLGSVMSMNGGLVMYKIWNTDDGSLCCIHPTVLRGIAIPRCSTMHMQNVLLLGEEKLVPLVLLKSFPGYRLGFEPDAVGYTTLPNDFWVLQGVQSRLIRAAFHAQISVQQVAWQLGIKHWIISTTQLMDMIFSMPIMVYLYSVFGRAIWQYGLAYTIIAASFAGLAALNVLLFVLRHQFRYIAWFVLYCFVAIPLFAIWFPVLAIWQSDDAEYWYDSWPTTEPRRRLHGIVDREETVDEEEEEEKYVPRLTLAEHELIEAERMYQAAQAALDSKFIGFANEVVRTDVTTPPPTQIRNGVHTTRAVKPFNLDMTTWRNDEVFTATWSPFDNAYHVDHSRSPSSSQQTDDSTLLNSSGFFTRLDILKEDEMLQEEEEDDDDRASTLSVTSATFSVYTPDLEESVTPRHRIVGGSVDTTVNNQNNGRNRAVHNFNIHSNRRHAK